MFRYGYWSSSLFNLSNHNPTAELSEFCRDSQSLEFSISGSPARKLPDLKTVFHDLPLFLDSISIETLQSQPKAVIWRAWKVRDIEGNIKL